MLNHPDFFNVRKSAIALTSGPLILLLLIVVVDFSWQQFKLRQSALCNTSAGIAKLNGNNDCSGFQQAVERVK